MVLGEVRGIRVLLLRGDTPLGVSVGDPTPVG